MVVLRMIKILLAIIAIALGGLIVLGGLLNGSFWYVLMGVAILFPGVWWFAAKPGQRQWKLVTPVALIAFVFGANMSPDTEPEQQPAAIMSAPSSSATPSTTTPSKTTTSRPTTTSRTTTPTTSVVVTTTSTITPEESVAGTNNDNHYVRDPEPAPAIAPDPEPGYPPAPAPAPEPETAPAQNVYYPNCKAAKAAGAAPLYQGDPGYSTHLDRDRDGIACER